MALLNNVPLNTTKAFVMATTPNGCEVYMPVTTTDYAQQQRFKVSLQHELNLRYIAPPKQLA